MGYGGWVMRNDHPVSCPRCGSDRVWKSGWSRAGKRQHVCQECDRCFVLEPYKPKIVIEVAERLLREGVPVPVISRVLTGYVSKKWIYNKRKELNG